MEKTICFVNTHYFPVLGGITQYTSNLIRELEKEHVNSIIVTLNVCNLADFEMENGTVIYRLPCINFMDGRFPVIKRDSKCKKMLKEISKHKIDLIVINARFYVLSIFMAMWSKKRKIKTIVIDHGSSHLTMGNKFMTMLGECYEHVSTSALKLFCKHYYGVSKASAEWLRHFGIQPKGVLYNAVNTELVKVVLQTPTRDFKAEYQLPAHAQIVTFTGRLVKEKGIMQLVEAVEKIRKQNRNVYLFIAGDGPLKKEIMSKCIKEVILLGQIELADIISLLKQSELLCLPSASEGFPTSVLEAVACKCYAVAANVGGAKEILPTKEFGTLLEKNDVVHIEKAILYVLNNPIEIKQAVEKSYERMTAEFTWEKTAKRLCEIL